MIDINSCISRIVLVLFHKCIKLKIHVLLIYQFILATHDADKLLVAHLTDTRVVYQW